MTGTSVFSGSSMLTPGTSIASDPSACLSTETLSTNTTDSSSFSFPREYCFPPFFTLQTNLTTLHAQSQKWSLLIQSYCAYHRIFRLTLSNHPLFSNTVINRHLALNSARNIVDFMVKDGRAEWIGDEKNLAWIWWRNPEEWAETIGGWVEETGQKNTVLTLYELVEGEGTRGQEFHGMDAELMQRALQVLIKRGKAQVFGVDDQQGVKFY